ncbi:hypothetical protein CP02DC22_0732B, partial [Chlamydia psittaci 02DC22]
PPPPQRGDVDIQIS